MWTDNETARDLLGFKVHADLIRSVVIDKNLLPVTLGIFADWGGGKTSLMRMLEESLDPDKWPDGSEGQKSCEKVVCLYFNGWQFEGYDDAKSAILSSCSHRWASTSDSGQSFVTDAPHCSNLSTG